MKSFLRVLLPMVIVAVVLYYVLIIILSDVLMGVVCAIVGEAFAPIPHSLLVMGCYLLGQILTQRSIKLRQPAERRAFLDQLGGNVYDRKKDRKAILSSRLFHDEITAYTLVTLVTIAVMAYTLVTKGGIAYLVVAQGGLPLYIFCIGMVAMFPILFAAFFLYDLYLWRYLREGWAALRIRLNPDGEGQGFASDEE
jgi:hypothetical protein